MTAPALPVEELLPQAKRLAELRRSIPSVRFLMEELRCGRPKAREVRRRMVDEANRAASRRDRVRAGLAESGRSPARRTVRRPIPVSGIPVSPGCPPVAPWDLAQPIGLVDMPVYVEPERPTSRTTEVDRSDSGAPELGAPVPAQVSQGARAARAILLTVVAVLLAGVIVAPIALSSQDIIAWAASATGLGLTGAWPTVVFLSLDAAAAVCVGLVVYCAWRGESAGVFSWLVWAFAGMSAYGNYSHSSGSTAADAVWFFPAMSVAGPFLLEVLVRRVRRWVQEGTGQRSRHGVSFGFARWIPGVGALRETYGAWRLARLDGLDDGDAAVLAYRRLCPDGSVRVLRALRSRDMQNPA